MSEMKMSDVWNRLPSYGVYDNAKVNGYQLQDGLYGMLFINEEPAKAIVHAVANHDRLTEENQKLREALEASTSMLENFWHNTGSLGAKAAAKHNRELLEQTK